MIFIAGGKVVGIREVLERDHMKVPGTIIQSINIIHGSIKNHRHKILKMLKYLKREEENLLKT